MGQEEGIILAFGGMSMLGVCAILLCCLYVYKARFMSALANVNKKPTTTPRTSAKGKPKPKSKCLPKRGDCAYTTRINVDGKWTCPGGYEDTGCNWKDGAEAGKLQCRACGENSPYAAYQQANPNCPPGFVPCNDKRFNYGDLKKNAKGEYYYDEGWGVDAPDYEWDKAGLNPMGGQITLNKGKFGGTDAHPEVFARGCCAWGNSVDDPERDAANKKIKVATTVVTALADAASIIAIPFTGGWSMAGSMALHGATMGASLGSSAAGGLIRAKCGGPTERYKKTKRSYMFKGPYKDGPRVRGTPGIWYTSGDGCPLKWLQYVPPGTPGM